MEGFKIRPWMVASLLLVIMAVVIVTGGLATVHAGTYQIKQAAVSGTMSAHMQPGMYMKMFGTITEWPLAETFYFTADNKEGGPGDDSIEVVFNDGSNCKISGTCRIVMPATESDALNLVMRHGFQSHEELQHKLVLPVIRNALNRTANLMSARESYSDRRPDFVNWAWDQIRDGLYEIDEETHKEKDLISGEMITKIVKVIRKDDHGTAIRQANPLKGMGVTLANFEIKKFVYSEKVTEQIASQQAALMAVATARANAQKAEQDALTQEAQGKAKVMEAKYEEEQKKVRAMVVATQEKEVAETAASKEVAVAKQQKLVAETNASKEVEVAKLQQQAAEFNKQKNILEGEGEAKRKQLVLEADGALAQKLQAYIEVNRMYADAMARYQGQWVPSVVMGKGPDGAQSNNGAQALIDMLTVKTAKDLALDLEVKTKNAQKK